LVLSCLPTDDRDLAASNREELLRRWSGRIITLEGDPSVLDPLL